ncbi:unnamed protein product [Triticum turgidum subsp. durum]|uniref:Exonuclease domain-containing protein n=1 Tax=Triticum turgidum subsp. durum TaxID=4567 RepID=A0A9R1QE44_TRITD|nr:unnamed protein product [Triticum turgidum subsp. durum]
MAAIMAGRGQGLVQDFDFFVVVEKPSYFDQWINLRVPFQAALGGGGRVNLQEAVRAAGLDWEGRLHCGLDDARNTARLLAELMRRGGQDPHHRLAGAAAADAEAAGSHKPLRWLTGAGVGAAADPAAAASHRPFRWLVCAGAGADPAAAAAASHDQPLRWASSATCLCYCGLASRGGVMQGKGFSGCANWSPAMGPVSPYFAWSN